MYFFVKPVDLEIILVVLQLRNLVFQLVSESVEEFLVAMLIVKNALHPLLLMGFIFETEGKVNVSGAVEVVSD